MSEHKARPGNTPAGDNSGFPPQAKILLVIMAAALIAIFLKLAGLL